MKGVKKQQRPALIPQLKNIKALASGGDHVLALDQKGNIWAWGCGEQGQLGHRVAERRRLDYLVPNPVGVPKNKITSISSGGYNGFALDIKGQVWTWGLNNFGQAGISNGAGDNNALVQRPSVVKSLKPYDIKYIVGGAHHSIACAQDGTLLTWGRCDDSQIGVLEKDLPKEDLLFDSRDRPRILKEPVTVPGKNNNLRSYVHTANIISQTSKQITLPQASMIALSSQKQAKPTRGDFQRTTEPATEPRIQLRKRLLLTTQP